LTDNIAAIDAPSKPKRQVSKTVESQILSCPAYANLARDLHFIEVLFPTHSVEDRIMSDSTVYRNVHGVEEWFVIVDEGSSNPDTSHQHLNIPAFASTVQKTRQWISELMHELKWNDAQKAYHGMRAVLHALRDRLTIPETADFAAQLPMLIRGMFYEGWQPDHVPVKDRTKKAFLAHIVQAFPDDHSVDVERLTHAVLKVVAGHVSQGEMSDIKAIIPKPLRELFPKEP
jgi:uncharacterized protein (DUF2267 family)